LEWVHEEITKELSTTWRSPDRHGSRSIREGLTPNAFVMVEVLESQKMKKKKEGKSET
jgi:hypothetical protein